VVDEHLAQPLGDAVVQGVLPAVRDDELGDDDGERDVWALAVQCLDVVGQWGDGRAVGRNDDLEGQVVAPCPPVGVKALRLFGAGADVHGQDGLGQRGGVGERS